MTTLFGAILAPFLGPILVAALVSQSHDGLLEGIVFDDHGKPVADAQIVLHVPTPLGSHRKTAEVRTTTNAEGRFGLTTTGLDAAAVLRADVWAYHPRWAIGSLPGFRLNTPLLLSRRAPRLIEIKGPAGQPVAGALIAPRVVSLAFFAGGMTTARVPDSMAARLAVTAGAGGTAMLADLPAAYQLVAVRVTAESIGTQDFVVTEQTAGPDQRPTIAIRLKPTSRLAGRVKNRAGEPLAGQLVEVWFQGRNWVEPNPVGFENGPLRTSADGSFQTPDNLLVGSPYRVVVRADGMEPILSPWITVGQNPRVLLPMIQRSLRTLSGRVVDRQGMALPGIEVFQAGDGPERTATTTDSDGQFALGGFRQGPVFLFARGEGFRFGGQLIKPGAAEITLELTRTSERPSRQMSMLREPVPIDESRALARRLIEPYWDMAVKNGNSHAMESALRALATADPSGVLEKLEVIDPMMGLHAMKGTVQGVVALRLARTDPARAESVVKEIVFPGTRATAMMSLADALEDRERNRKLALLDLTAQAAMAPGQPTMRLHLLGGVAEQYDTLGEHEKAKPLFTEGIRLVNSAIGKNDGMRGVFAGQLVQFDMTQALAVTRDFAPAGSDPPIGLLRKIAVRLAADRPAEAERVLRQVPQRKGREWLPPAMAWQMATIDPARAQKLVEESQRLFDQPQSYLFLALGLKSRDRGAAEHAFQTAMQGIDRLMMQPEASRLLGVRWNLLPLVERIDPALVPEYFWRVVALRPPIGDPRAVRDTSSSRLVGLVSWYDRDVAAALFDSVRTEMEQADDLELAGSDVDFLGWSSFDPRAAIARLEQVPITTTLEPDEDSARVRVAEMLGLPHEERWRRYWSDYTGLTDLFQRDLK